MPGDPRPLAYLSVEQGRSVPTQPQEVYMARSSWRQGSHAIALSSWTSLCNIFVRLNDS